MRRCLSLLCTVFVLARLGQAAIVAQQATQQATPTIDQLISLKRAGSPAISPTGQWIAYTVRETNWDENSYHTEIWLADARTGDVRQLTSNAKKSSTAPAWSPDSRLLAFATDRDEKRQIYVIDPRGGEARKLTSAEEGVGSFAWSPDGTSFAFTSVDPRAEADKEREKKYGEFDVFGEGYRMSHLWVFDMPAQKARRLTSGPFTIGQFTWSPDGKQIAFDHRINSANANGGSADISIVAVADGSVRHLVTQEGPDSGPVWSPDGSKIAFETSMAKPFYFYTNRVIAVVPSVGGPIEPLSTAFDEDTSIVRWTAAGIYFTALQHTSSRHARREETRPHRLRPWQAGGGVDRIRLQHHARRAVRRLHGGRRLRASGDLRVAASEPPSAQADRHDRTGRGLGARRAGGHHLEQP